MPRGDGIYDEEHDNDDTNDAAEKKKTEGKRVPEDTPDVDTATGTGQEPPD